MGPEEVSAWLRSVTVYLLIALLLLVGLRTLIKRKTPEHQMDVNQGSVLWQQYQSQRLKPKNS
jgi:hypothetical protein